MTSWYPTNDMRPSPTEGMSVARTANARMLLRMLFTFDPRWAAVAS